MRSLYALHPQTVLELHDRGAVVYGRPVALSPDEAEERVSEEPFTRVVVDHQLFQDGDALRTLRRITSMRPDLAVAWLRPGRAIAGALTLESLARELSGQEADHPGMQVVVLSATDPESATGVAFAVACHLSMTGPVWLVESDTTSPSLGRMTRVSHALSDFMEHGSNGLAMPRWPYNLRIVPAPADPGLLLRLGMEPLAARLESVRLGGDVVVRAGGNLSDRGLLGALSHASDVLMCGDLQSDYAHWLSQLSPRSQVHQITAGRLSHAPSRAARAGERIWQEVTRGHGA